MGSLAKEQPDTPPPFLPALPGEHCFHTLTFSCKSPPASSCTPVKPVPKLGLPPGTSIFLNIWSPWVSPSWGFLRVGSWK